MDIIFIDAVLFFLIATITPFITILPCQQAAVKRDKSHLTWAHTSHSCCRGCYPWSLHTAALAASKEPHCAHHDRIPTASDAWPPLRRHVPRLITPLIFSANAGAVLTPLPPYSPTMLGELQSAPPHVMPFWGPPCRGNPIHAVAHSYLRPSTMSPPHPPSSFSPGVMMGYNARCCASCLATVHLVVIVSLLSTCSVY